MTVKLYVVKNFTAQILSKASRSGWLRLQGWSFSQFPVVQTKGSKQGCFLKSAAQLELVLVILFRFMPGAQVRFNKVERKCHKIVSYPNVVHLTTGILLVMPPRTSLERLPPIRDSFAVCQVKRE